MDLGYRITRKVKSVLDTSFLTAKQRSYSRIQKSNAPIRYNLPLGVTIDLYPQGQIAELLYTSKFEYPELELVISYLKPGMNVIDIGANIGLYSIISDKMIGKTGQIWAFEPSGETQGRLLANLSLNEVSTIKVEKLALSDVADANLTLQRDPGYRDGDRYLSTRRIENHQVECDPADSGDVESVHVTSLDHYLYELNDVRSSIHFLKMDIEGGEFDVFKGAQRTLRENPDILVMFECTPQGCACNGHRVDDVIDYLNGIGFSVFCWDAAKKGWDDRREVTRAAGNLWACRKKESLPLYHAN